MRNTAKIERQRGQRLLAAGEKRQRRRLLAGRLRQDFEAGFERVVALDELQLGVAAAEQLGEQMLEVLVDDLERGQQPFARLGVETVDALAQALDRLDQVVALAGELVVLLLDLAQLFFGAQVDGAEPLALAPDAIERGLDIGNFGQRLVGLDLGEFGNRVRPDFEYFVDFVREIGEPASRAFVALLGARGLGARFAQDFERGARGLVGLGKFVLGRGQTVGGGTAPGLGGFDFADQIAALFGKDLRRILKLGALLCRLLRTRLDGGDLGGGVVVALAPAFAFDADGLQPAVGKLGLARDRLRLGAQFRQRAALVRDLALNSSELGFEIGGGRQRGERRFASRYGRRWPRLGLR